MFLPKENVILSKFRNDQLGADWVRIWAEIQDDSKIGNLAHFHNFQTHSCKIIIEILPIVMFSCSLW